MLPKWKAPNTSRRRCCCLSCCRAPNCEPSQARICSVHSKHSKALSERTAKTYTKRTTQNHPATQTQRRPRLTRLAQRVRVSHTNDAASQPPVRAERRQGSQHQSRRRCVLRAATSLRHSCNGLRSNRTHTCECLVFVASHSVPSGMVFATGVRASVSRAVSRRVSCVCVFSAATAAAAASKPNQTYQSTLLVRQTPNSHTKVCVAWYSACVPSAFVYQPNHTHQTQKCASALGALLFPRFWHIRVSDAIPHILYTVCVVCFIRCLIKTTPRMHERTQQTDSSQLIRWDGF